MGIVKDTIIFEKNVHIAATLTVSGDVPLSSEASNIVAGMSEPAPIVCLGDSLTYGDDGGSQIDEPYPAVLASMTGRTVINKGLNSYIPRHRVWKFLVDEAPTILKSDLLDIPPTEYEDRVYQPTTNNLRTFYADGQQIWVHEGVPSEASSTLYEFDADSTATVDDDEVLMPSWVGGNKSNPEYLTGRWVKQVGDFAQTTDGNLLQSDFILWLGANGMEAEDTVSSIKMLLRNRGPRIGDWRCLTLMNRNSTGASSGTIRDWTTWTTNVNEALKDNFPGRVIDIDGYFMGRGAVGKIGNYPPVDATDISDIAAGIMPSSIANGSSHFNALGYREIANFVAKSITGKGRRPLPHIAMKGINLMFSPRSEAGIITDYNRKAISLISATDATVANQMTNETTSRPLVTSYNGVPVLKFTGVETISNQFASVSASPNTLFAVVKLTELPSSRDDVMDSYATSQRTLISVQDYSGTKYWRIYANKDAPTTFTADTDWHTIVAVFNSTSSYFYLDGTKSSALDPGNLGMTGLKIGGLGAAATKALYAEFGHYDGAADDAWVAAYHTQALLRYEELFA